MKNRCLIIYPLILFLFLSCNINDYLPQKPTYYNVTFYSNNQIVDVQKVKEGSFVKEIQAPTAQEGKNFLFWSTTPNGKTNYFAYQSAIKSDIDLYAIWEDKNLYTVTFLVDDKPINELAVYEDDIVIFPTIENMDGRYLAFWYTGETILYGTSISVTSDLTIKAMLLPIGVTCDGFSIISIDDSIEELAIPKGITSISPSAGERCFVLKRLVIPSTVKKIGYSAFRQCISLEELILEEGIEEIESSAFSNCSSLSSIVFPKTLRLIGDSAFSGSGIREVIIKDFTRSPSIGYRAFARCNQLEYVDIEISGTIQLQTFMGCTNLKHAQILANTIGDGSFEDCINLKTVNLMEGVSYIGSWAFQSCQALQTITIPSTVKEISSYAFSLCTSLDSLEIKSKEVDLYYGAFSGCHGLTKIQITGKIDSLGSNCFSYCNALETLEIPYCASISSNAFESCSKLSSVTILDGLRIVYDEAFLDCKSLTNITLPSTVINMASTVFKGCTSLTRIKINKPENSLQGYETKWGATNAVIYWE